MSSERYGLAAKADGGASFTQMRGPMLRTLLERRFQLKAHRETREGRVYELTVANDGVKIKPPKEGGCISIDVNHLPPSPPPGEPRRMGNMGGAIICS